MAFATRTHKFTLDFDRIQGFSCPVRECETRDSGYICMRSSKPTRAGRGWSGQVNLPLSCPLTQTHACTVHTHTRTRTPAKLVDSCYRGTHRPHGDDLFMIPSHSLMPLERERDREVILGDTQSVCAHRHPFGEEVLNSILFCAMFFFHLCNQTFM